MLPSQASGAYGISFEIDINRGDDLSLKEHWQDHAQAGNGKGHGNHKRAAADADDEVDEGEVLARLEIDRRAGMGEGECSRRARSGAHGGVRAPVRCVSNDCVPG